jgi:hypothetical protein
MPLLHNLWKHPISTVEVCCNKGKEINWPNNSLLFNYQTQWQKNRQQVANKMQIVCLRRSCEHLPLSDSKKERNVLTNFSKFPSTKFHENMFCSSTETNPWVLEKPRHSSSSPCSTQLRRMWQSDAVLYVPRFDNDLSINSDIPNTREAAFYKTAHAQTRHTAVNLDHQVLTLGRSVGSRRNAVRTVPGPFPQHSILISVIQRPFFLTDSWIRTL